MTQSENNISGDHDVRWRKGALNRIEIVDADRRFITTATLGLKARTVASMSFALEYVGTLRPSESQPICQRTRKSVPSPRQYVTEQLHNCYYCTIPTMRIYLAKQVGAETAILDDDALTKYKNIVSTETKGKLERQRYCILDASSSCLRLFLVWAADLTLKERASATMINVDSTLCQFTTLE